MRIKASLLTSLLVVLAIGAIFSFGATSVHAQTIDQSDLTPANGWTCNPDNTSCTNPEVGTATCAPGTTTCTIALNQQGANAITDQVSSLANPVGHALWNAGSSLLSGIAATAISTVAYFILIFATYMLGLAGSLLNWVMLKTVFEFSTLIGNSAGLLTAWGILRDMGNMVLLFGFIFIGLATILDLHTYTAKKTLPFLIIFAVLMNFSLFAAEAVIDTANGFSSVLYKQAGLTTCPGISTSGTTSVTSPGTGGTELIQCSTGYGIAGHIMDATGLSGIFGAGGITTDLPGAAVTVVFALFATVGLVVLIGAAVMLVVRAVMLTLLMVTAPLGFAGMAVPPLRKLATEWWHRLISQAFFAPVFLLLVFVSLKITDGLASSETRRSLAGVLSQPGASNTSVVFLFTIAIGFLIASLMAAKSMGATGADMALNAATKVAKSPYTVGRYLGGQATGFAGRQTLGRGGKFVQKRYEHWLGKKLPKGESPSILRRALQANVLGIDAGLSAGLTAVRGGKYGGERGFDEAQKHHQARLGRARRGFETMEREGALEEAMRRAEAAIATKDSKELLRANEKMAELLQKMDATEIKALDEVKYMRKGIDLLGANLSPEMFERLMNDDEFPDDQKDSFKDNRFKALIESSDRAAALFALPSSSVTPAIREEREVLKRGIQRTSVRDIELLAKYRPDAYTSVASALDANGNNLLSGDQQEGLKKSSYLTNTQRQFTQAQTRQGRVETTFDHGDIDGAMNQMLKMGAPDIAKLPARILAHPKVGAKLTAAHLTAIASRGAMRDERRLDLAKIVHDRAAAGDAELKYLLDKNKDNQAFIAFYSLDSFK